MSGNEWQREAMSGNKGKMSGKEWQSAGLIREAISGNLSQFE